MKKNLLLALLVTIVISGCAPSRITPTQPMKPRHYSDNAVADIVKIIKVEKSDLNDGLIDAGTFVDTQYIYPNAYKYTIEDNLGVSYNVYEISDQQDFSTGDCVLRWWDRADNTYPRLSKAGPNCTLIKKEPATSKVATNQQFTSSLKRQAILNSWIGYRESDLVLSWGIPTNKFESDGIRFLEYNYKDTKVNTSYLRNVYGNIVASDVYSNTYTCNTQWIIKKGIIVGYKENGNSCY